LALPATASAGLTDDIGGSFLAAHGEELEARVQGPPARIDDPAARHGPQDRAGQRHDQLQDGFLRGVRSHGFPTLFVVVL
jgi:hypothetical protein